VAAGSRSPPRLGRRTPEPGASRWGVRGRRCARRGRPRSPGAAGRHRAGLLGPGARGLAGHRVRRGGGRHAGQPRLHRRDPRFSTAWGGGPQHARWTVPSRRSTGHRSWRRSVRPSSATRSGGWRAGRGCNRRDARCCRPWCGPGHGDLGDTEDGSGIVRWFCGRWTRGRLAAANPDLGCGK